MLPPRPSRLAVAVALGVSLLALMGCGHHSDGLIKGHIDLGLTTTTGSQPCDVPRQAERALSEASVTATQPDATSSRQIDAELDRLAASVPRSLTPSVRVIRQAFLAVRAHPRATHSPFDSTAYASADQAILRYVEGGCVATAASGGEATTSK